MADGERAEGADLMGLKWMVLKVRADGFEMDGLKGHLKWMV